MSASASLPTDTLLALLRPQRLTAVVDVGANPIDGDAPYKPMLSRRLCTVTGFEPQPDGLASLNARKTELETYLPYVIGDGSPGTLHIAVVPGMTSLFEPNPAVLKWFNGFAEWATVKEKLPVTTRRLDDLSEIAALDLLKIDVQGAEVSVFNGGRERLQRAVAVHTEVCFLSLYKGQPLFGEIDLELRSLGLIPHHIDHVNKRTILPAYDPSAPNSALNQVLFADVVYVRDFTKAEAMDDEQLKHLAIIAYTCYGSFDLAAHCLFRLAERKAVVPEAVELFMNSVRTGAGAA
jgi:FkbM family methyltransferase